MKRLVIPNRNRDRPNTALKRRCYYKHLRLAARISPAPLQGARGDLTDNFGMHRSPGASGIRGCLPGGELLGSGCVEEWSKIGVRSTLGGQELQFPVPHPDSFSVGAMGATYSMEAGGHAAQSSSVTAAHYTHGVAGYGASASLQSQGG